MKENDVTKDNVVTTENILKNQNHIFVILRK